MSSRAAQIADAAVADLGAGQFSQEFTAVRKWIAKWTLPDLGTLRVTVVPGPASYEPLDRRRDDERHEMDLAVQKKVNPNDNGEVDALVGLLEEFVEHFRCKDLSAGGRQVRCVGRRLIPGSEAAVAKEHLADFRSFTGVLRTTWLVRQ
jgi:hypothetical protein